MTTMTLPQRISDFLSLRQERMYCDTCIQGRLGLKWRQQVQLITATLAVTAAFRREFNKCCTCGEIKQVTHSIGNAAPPAAAAALAAQRLQVSAAPRRRRGKDLTAPSAQRLDFSVASSAVTAQRREAN
jgi:hypothetical protein